MSFIVYSSCIKTLQTWVCSVSVQKAAGYWREIDFVSRWFFVGRGWIRILLFLTCCFMLFVSQVDEIYHDESLGTNINIVLVRMILVGYRQVSEHLQSFWRVTETQHIKSPKMDFCIVSGVKSLSQTSSRDQTVNIRRSVCFILIDIYSLIFMILN